MSVKVSGSVVSRFRRAVAVLAAAAIGTAGLVVPAVGSATPPAATPPAAAPPGAIAPVRPCADLEGDYDLPGARTHVTKAAIVTPEGEPERCEVTGFVEPAVRFVVRLPTQEYKGRYLQYGCGGFCGAISATPFPDCGPAAGEFAVAATDDGHAAPPAGEEDGAWGADNQAARDDWEFRAPHVTSVAAKQLIATYYGEGPRHSYFSSCSNGGREAMLLAQRYPHDFDGIIAGAPAATISLLAGMHLAWGVLVNRDADGNEILTAADLPILHTAAVAACDTLDGLLDGQIDDPRDCRFDPAVVRCPDGGDGDGCLSAAQVTAARKMYAGPTDRSGRRLYPGGQTPGSELAWAAWHVELSGFSISRDLASAYLKYLGYPIGTPHSSLDQIEFTARELHRLTAEGRRSNALSLELSAFRRAGGKLILWHGWADPAIPAAGTLDYYERLTSRNGGRAATQRFARTFMVPSMYHCGGGSALTEFDATQAVVDWVERGDAPDRIDAVGRDDAGQVVRTRPVFPYPLRARYDGSGSIDDAANFVPERPTGPVRDRIRWLGEYLHQVPGPVAG